MTAGRSLPRHILMTADTVGGVWTYAIELCRELVDRGSRISLATMGAPLSSSQRNQVSRLGLDVYESAYKLEWMEKPWTDVDAAGSWLLDLEHKLQPDLVHLNSFAHGSLRWQSPAIVVGHSCVFSWWNSVHRAAPPDEWNIYRRRVRDGLLAADAVVAVSRCMLWELERWYGALRNGSVVYNGHRSEEYKPGTKEELVLGTGRMWDAAKNIERLDAAARFTLWPVFVAGEAQHPEGGSRQLKHACALGKLAPDELKTWYSKAGIYALPALYEPFGLSVLEAALSGCALVLGDIPSLREIWRDAALFVPSADPEALTLAVNALISNRAKREEMSWRARARALEFSMERMVEGYANVYHQAVSRFNASGDWETPCAS